MKHLVTAFALFSLGAAFVGVRESAAQEAPGVRIAMMELARRAPLTSTSETAAAPTMGVERSSRPSPLMQSLYATTVLMQGLDAHSTFRALDAGAKQGNPLIGPIAERRPAFIALKGAISVATIRAARDLSKRNKLAAALTLIGINSAYGALIANNYRVVSRIKEQR